MLADKESRVGAIQNEERLIKREGGSLIGFVSRQGDEGGLSHVQSEERLIKRKGGCLSGIVS